MTAPDLTTKVLSHGPSLDQAAAAVILIHGRRATAESIIRLSAALDQNGSLPVTWLAPQAQNNSWYPLPFLEKLEANEPHRSHALGVIGGLIEQVIDAGVSRDRIGLVGFSQGACLSLEYAAVGERMPGFVGALSGGVMGPLEEDRAIDGSRDGMNVFIGCGDQDSHIALPYAKKSAKLLRNAGATVDYRTYQGMGHTINDDELQALRDAVQRLIA